MIFFSKSNQFIYHAYDDFLILLIKIRFILLLLEFNNNNNRWIFSISIMCQTFTGFISISYTIIFQYWTINHGRL